MKFKLLDVETDTHETEVGSCDLCMSIQTVDEPVYVIEVDGKQYRVDGYNWDWGHYDEIVLDNVIEFANYLNEHEFKGINNDILPEELFYDILHDFSYYGNAEDYEVK